MVAVARFNDQTLSLLQTHKLSMRKSRSPSSSKPSMKVSRTWMFPRTGFATIYTAASGKLSTPNMCIPTMVSAFEVTTRYSCKRMVRNARPLPF